MKRNLLKGLMLAVTIIALSATIAMAASAILYDYNDTDGNSANVAGENYLLYEFIPTNSYNVYCYDVYIKRVGSLTGTESYVSAIYEMNAADWSNGGSVLGGHPGYLFDDLSTDYAWIRFYPSANVTLSAGTKYSIQLRFPAGDGASGKYIHWREHTAAGHNEWWVSDGGNPPSVWSYSDNSSGAYFRVYGHTNPIYYPGGGETPTISDNNTDTGLFEVCIDQDDGTSKKYITTDNITWTYIQTYTGYGCVDSAQATGVVILDAVDDSVESIMDLWGLNNDTGRAIVVLITMLGLYFLFRRQKQLKVIFPTVAFVVFMAMGWIATWVVILGAVGVGVFAFGLLNRRRQDA